MTRGSYSAQEAFQAGQRQRLSLHVSTARDATRLFQLPPGGRRKKKKGGKGRGVRGGKDRGGDSGGGGKKKGRPVGMSKGDRKLQRQGKGKGKGKKGKKRR